MAESASWVFDTNILVSGLLSALAPPGRLVDMLVARLEAFLAIISFQDQVTCLPWAGRLPPDIDDVMFLEAALASAEAILVTGNIRHFPTACRGLVRVLSPREAWDLFIERIGAQAI